jgi:hypothetical protein
MLLRVHKILIGAAITLGGLFALRAFVLFAREGATLDLGMGLGALIVTTLLVVYLRKVLAKYRGGGRSSPPT